MEMKIYERQVTKQAISKRVIDEQQIDRHYNSSDLQEFYNFEPEPPGDRPTPNVPKDLLLGELLQKHEKLIYKYHEHQTLLENKEDEELNEEERKAAWEEFENEKKNRHNFSYGTGTGNIIVGGDINHIPKHTLVAALTNIIRRENPTYTAGQISTVMPALFQELAERTAAGDLRMSQRVLKEVYDMKVAAQQRKIQEYYQLQQQKQLFQQFQSCLPTGLSPADTMRYFQEWMKQNHSGLANANAFTSIPSGSAVASGNSTAQMNSNEVVQIDD